MTAANISAIIMLLLALLAGIETDKPVVAAGPEHAAESEWRPFEATAYTADCRGCIGITKTGIDVRHTIDDESGYRIISVDPDVIPLGSKMEIRIGNDISYEVIVGIAADIGGAIRGNRIDVLMDSTATALEFGRQGVEVRILETEE